MSNEIRELLANINSEDKESIIYSPAIGMALNNTEAAILLSCIIKIWYQNDRQPFFKFKEPCNHPDYEEGSSWVEMLGFSRKYFDTALKLLRVSKNRNAKTIAIIETKVDINRRTFYSVNEERLQDFLLGKIELDERDNLYLISNPHTKLLKIGRTNSIKTRLKTIKYQLKNEDISLVKELPKKGELEKEIHEKFEKYRVEGEWFEDVPEIREFFKNFK